MAQKLEQTGFDESLALKTALQSKELYPRYESGQAVYDGVENDQHLLHDERADGWFRSVNINQNQVRFDFIDSRNDSALVRIWTEIELYNLIGIFSGVSFSNATFSNPNWTHVITFNGQNFQGVDPIRANAMAIAFTNVLNSF